MTLSRDFQFEIDGQIYHVEASVNYYVDRNYGADADGNRGVSQSFVEIEEITAEDDHGNEPSERIWKCIEEKVLDHEWDAECD